MKRIVLKILLAGIAFALSACAIPARQTEALLAEIPHDIPAAHEVPQVPFVKQSANYCGPATLTMAMNWAGQKVTIDQIAPEVYTPGKKGTLQIDMLSASRRNGMLAVPIFGVSNLVHEVAAGHPVIVFENLGLTWYPFWHYALVYGYDLKEAELILHSGPDQGRRIGMKKFERSWMLGDYWGLVVLPPTELAATGTELAHAAAGAGLEQIGKVAEAEMVYRNMLTRWPESFGALIGLGNITYARSDFADSVHFLRLATKFHAASPEAWHNRTVAEAAAGHRSEARTCAAKAVELAPVEMAAVYEENLKAWLPKGKQTKKRPDAGDGSSADVSSAGNKKI